MPASVAIFTSGFLQAKPKESTQAGIHAGHRGAHARLKPGCICRAYQAFSVHAPLFFEQQPSTGCYYRAPCL
jgi:hypothetical protein